MSNFDFEKFYFTDINHRNYSACLEAVKLGYGLSLIPEQHLTEELCLESIRKDIRNFFDIPYEKLNQKICLELVKLDVSFVRRIPKRFTTDKGIIQAILNSNDYLKYMKYIPEHMRPFV